MRGLTGCDTGGLVRGTVSGSGLTRKRLAGGGTAGSAPAARLRPKGPGPGPGCPAPARLRPKHTARLRSRRTGAFRTSTGAAIASMAALSLLLAGCNPGGEGVRTEGTASSTPAPKDRSAQAASPSPSASVAYQKVDAVNLMKHDPKVGADVKKSLAKPCAADEYPVEVTYAKLTGGKDPDVVVNVMTCADSVGIGSYVYRRNGGGYDNVFANEQPSVYAGVNKGELEVSKQTYNSDDNLCCASGEDVMTYRWTGSRFVEYARYHTDYSKTGGTEPAPADPTGPED